MPEETAPRTVVVQEIDGVKYHVNQAFKFKERLQVAMQQIKVRRDALEKNGKPIPVELIQESNTIMRDALVQQLWDVEGEGYEGWERGDLDDLIAPHVQQLMWSLGMDFIPEDVMATLPTPPP